MQHSEILSLSLMFNILVNCFVTNSLVGCVVYISVKAKLTINHIWYMAKNHYPSISTYMHYQL